MGADRTIATALSKMRDQHLDMILLNFADANIGGASKLRQSIDEMLKKKSQE